jgi:O-antigen ligase
MIVRRIGLLALFLTLLVPLLITPGLQWPFITGKAFFFRAMVCVAALASFASPAPRNGRPLNALLTVLLPVSLIADIGAADFRLALAGNLERMDGFTGLLSLALYAMALSRLLVTPALRRGYLAGWCVVSLAVAAVSFFQVTHITDRPWSTLGNADYLGGYLALSALLAAHLAGRWRAWWGVFAIDVAALLTTNVLAPAVGLAAGLVVIGWRQNRRALVDVVAILPLLCAGAYQVDAVARSPWVDHVARKLAGSDLRPLIWTRTLDAIAMRPVLGWGHEGLTKAPTALVIETGKPLDRAHNLVLDWLVEAGIIGLLAHTIVIRRMWQENEGQPWLLAMIAAWLALGMFSFDTLSVSMPIYAIIGLSEYRDVLGRTGVAADDQTHLGAGD